MGGGDKAPKAYTPANQADADSAYYGTLSGLTNQDQAGAATANAGYNAAYSGIANNPFSGSMVQGVTDAAGTANRVAGADLNSGAAATAASGQGYGDATTAASLAAPMGADANTLRAYAPLLAEFGLDPNMSEYNFGLKQTQDTQNVSNAEQGLAGSPFAAGATGDAMAAYNRNYEGSRSTKAMQALAAMAQLFSGAGGLDTSAIAGLSSAGDMRGKAADLAGTGSNLSHTGVETQATAATMPYVAANQPFQDRIDALGKVVGGEATSSGNIRGDVQGYGNYLNIGQNATALDQNAAKINAQNSFMGQLGALIGTLGPAAMKLLPQGG